MKKPPNKQFVLSRRACLFLAFFVPFAVYGVCFALNKTFPFGDSQILTSDLRTQFFPFLADYLRKIKQGKGAFPVYSFTQGLGLDYSGVIAYYLASPLNYILLPLPESLWREGLTLLIMARVGLASLFFAFYAERKSQKTADFSACVFSWFYAFSAFFAGYYWSYIWLDAAALLPLVILHLESFVEKNDARSAFFYALTLFSAFYSNYYIGFFICVFIAIRFFCLCVQNGFEKTAFLKKMSFLLLLSALALGATAFLTVPAFFALTGSASYANDAPAWEAGSPALILSRFLPFTEPTVMNGPPNVYSGFLPFLLIPAYLCAAKVSKKEKLLFLAQTAFFVLILTLPPLDYALNGFHNTVSLPYRYTFLLSFLVISAGYEGFLRLEALKTSVLFLPSVIFLSAAAIFCAIGFDAGLGAVLPSFLIACIYACLLYLYAAARNYRAAVALVAAAVCFGEGFAQVFSGVSLRGVTSRSAYSEHAERSLRLLSHRPSLFEAPFNRTEMTDPYLGANDASLFGYEGVSVFSSTSYENMTKALERFGLKRRLQTAIRYAYAETSPFTGMFLNIGYLINSENEPADGAVFYAETAREGGGVLLESVFKPSIGYAVSPDITNPVYAENVFLYQNALFNQMTGLEGRLFTLCRPLGNSVYNYSVSFSNGTGSYAKAAAQDDDGYITFDYAITENGVYYGYCAVEHQERVGITKNYRLLRAVDATMYYMFTAGYFSAGETASILTDLRAPYGDCEVYFAKIDEALFRRGAEILENAAFNTQSVTDTRIQGDITVADDALLVMSVPLGGFTPYVNGEKREAVPFLDAFCAVPLSAGQNNVVWRYENGAVTAGRVISAASLLGFIAVFVFAKRAKRGA